MKRSLLITPIKLAIICTLMLASCLLGEDRGGTAPGEGRSLIGGVFSKAHASGSLEYWGSCDFKKFYPDFPKLKRIPGQEGSALELLRKIFSLDRKMRVGEDADGRIRLIEEDVPSDLLDVRIHHLRFPPEYHGPQVAVSVILHSPEVIAFRREHNIGPEADWGPLFSFPSNAFAVGKPSVHGDLDNVTVGQALDYVLLAFPGFWLYENCQSSGGSRIVLFGFFENDVPPAQVQK